MAMLYIPEIIMVLHLVVVMIFIFQITQMEALLLTQTLVTPINHQVDMDTTQSKQRIFLPDPITSDPTKLKHFTCIDQILDFACDIFKHIKNNYNPMHDS